ncbi:folylpolyglutamate synthase/dihydrofolate synthase family protein [Robiginitalea sp. SC105]|uniref:bifunctional folylpolyglutamate synthase/dihydrofolate synthase n=1 Tax=Robiginitalea sp. SC105 TaxID=2762332 RepID=UPI00163AF969|nr:folylpolyglutamate synthase/dihydrofolate synthase family protein [Robiginitalea sp. SC105]MBC2839505.1 bifunctional folylpolyglutamate synthase/dihydrofolate synthase [Robiginitalea sp. SC105]
MTYRQTLDWMFARLPMYQQQGATAYQGKLEPIRDFAARLGHPESAFRSIHVAGTNGKGSSSHMLASVLQEAGYNVGLYTSPHLKDFRERIRVNGKPVPEAYVIEFIAQHKPYLEKAGLSFFELTVGMAFAYFASREVDIAVVEVGLGGRLDATNIITPEVSLITNIGLDHTEFLGKEPRQIAGEKAGIIKPGVPVVISETQPDIADVFTATAQMREAPIRFADQQEWPDYPVSLLGSYQQRNLRGVLATLDTLNVAGSFRVNEKAIRKGLASVSENTGLMGRWQILREHPRVLCDTAHNREGLELVLEQLARQSYRTLHFVLGFVKEKDLDGILPLFPREARYYLSRPNIPRGMPVETLAAAVERMGLDAQAFQSIAEAYQAAMAAADPEDLIFIGGSNFTVAEVL